MPALAEPVFCGWSATGAAFRLDCTYSCPKAARLPSTRRYPPDKRETASNYPRARAHVG
jgi:hypothetical protein